jgi:DNA-binding NarL/FixJ family response regulator
MLTLSIVEDTDAIRERLVRQVERMPDVELVSTYRTGIEAYDGLLHTQPNLVIMDIGLPGMSGTELLARLAAKDFIGDALMFTVFDHEEKLFLALKLGAKGYILKEEGATGVAAAIEEYRRGGAPMSRSIAQKVLNSFAQTRDAKASSKIEDLTEQQTKILKLMADGLLNKEVAIKLGLTEGAIKQHNNRIYRKLSVNNRVEAIRLFLENAEIK